MRWAMRIFGALNIVASLLSLYYFAGMIQLHLGKWPGHPSRHDWIVFYAIAAVSTLIVVGIAFLGAMLIRGNPNAVWLTALLFFTEIAFECAFTITTWLGEPVSRATIAVGFWGIADSPTEAQALSGYSVLGLVAAIVLFLVQRHRDSSRITAAD